MTSLSLPPSATLLVVDDDPLVTTSLAAFLALETPYTVHTLNDPTEALAQLDALKPDLVLSDFLMPGLNGIEFLTQVRERLPDASLILLTGYADKDSAMDAINRVGLYRYLEKPWNNQELLLTIHNGLERARLMVDLRTTIDELEHAQDELRRYNQHLEVIVTERTQAIQQTLAHLQAIVQTSGDGIVTVDGDGTIVSANPTARHWLPDGVEPCHQKLSDVLALEANVSLSEECVCEGEWGLLSDPASRRAVEVAISPIPMSGEASFQKTSLFSDDLEDAARLKGSSGALLMVRDVSKRKAMERLREDFVATLTHDLRVPLLAAIQTLGLMSKGVLGPLNDKQTEITGMLITNHQDLLGLVNTLLDIYRYDSGQKDLTLETVDGVGLLHQVRDELQALAAEKKQTVVAPELTQPIHFQADRMELKRVIINLVGNAIQHTPAGGTITAAITAEATGTRLTVSDTGRGIPAEDIPRLFERFSQGTKKVRSSGSGLGLYLSHQIVTRHNGTLTVQSRSESDDPHHHGTTFTVWLPKALSSV
ncbi:MAG: ATP-binding protein [Vampirovibrionales bacterium]|nr:ATP-binding protein [Vampirovibrionales bacterium]